ncbi:MAG: adenylate/guanylate cyclase domain-containing protein, partial [Saprospiraceae bacterium]|nr:adenylate/guanylate cyclase domain-containing protein [Saprospiraceae bacterium]
MSSVRKLAVIMFTDIAGYSAMMQRNEKHALSIAQMHEEIVNAESAHHDGEVINFMGDGSLCKFNSITDALDAALSIQAACKIARTPVPLRIGIHWGDIIEQDGKVYGDGVNIASRIESLGLPGSILFSKGIYDQIKNKSVYKTENLGTFSLKNIDDPLAIFALTNDGLTIPKKLDTEDSPGSDTQTYSNLKIGLGIAGVLILIIAAVYFGKNLLVKPSFPFGELSIAVLPFKNLNNDPERDYYSLGLSEDLIGALSKHEDLQVAARSASFSYQNKETDLRRIGQELNVATILDGNVRRSDDQLVINVELVDASNGFAIWHKSFSKAPNAVFSIQEEITKEVISHLGVSDEKSSRIGLTENTEAYNLYLKGRHAWNLRTQNSLSMAVKFFEESIGQDQNYAVAYAGLADAYAVQGFYDYLPPSEAFQKSRAAAKKALDIDAGMAKPHATLGYIALYYDWNWADAEKKF